MENKLKVLLAELMDIDPSTIATDTKLTTDLGMDELDIVEFVMAIEDEFNIEIDGDRVEKLDTFGQFAAYVSTQM